MGFWRMHQFVILSGGSCAVFESWHTPGCSVAHTSMHRQSGDYRSLIGPYQADAGISPMYVWLLLYICVSLVVASSCNGGQTLGAAHVHCTVQVLDEYHVEFLLIVQEVWPG